MVSSVVKSVSPSATISLINKENALKAAGKRVISFSLGEPDFTTPIQILDYASEKMREGYTHYTQSPGIPELRKKIAEKFSIEKNVKIDDKSVLVTPTKFALYASYLALLDPGDEILIPDPGWVSYIEMAHLVGAKPVYYKLDEKRNFSLDQEDIKNKIGEKTKAIVINSPNNPTGSVLSNEDLKFLRDIVRDRKITVISDEIYEKLVFEGKHESFLNDSTLLENSIIVSGFSKSHAMTGLRIGYMISSEEMIKYVDRIQQHTMTCAATYSQYAALKALDDDSSPEKMKMEYRKRRDVLVEGLKEIPIFKINPPQATFYMYPEIDYKGMDSMEFSNYLLEKLYISVVPGIAFGPSGKYRIRISFSTGIENIKEGIERLKNLK
ncbi:MAG: pyridoxal phosphate-dependent aminotransferase [Thermoplasmata archaeon]